MSYSEDAVNAKLSALNETQESIVTTAQWVMFHRCVQIISHCLITHEVYRRYAERTIKLWLDKLGVSSPAKRLNLIYLINGRQACVIWEPLADVCVEVAQQSKFRKREEFRAALAAVSIFVVCCQFLIFPKIIADGVSVAYNGATNDIKTKIKRVIDVWKDREIFDENVRDDIDRRVDGMCHE